MYPTNGPGLIRIRTIFPKLVNQIMNVEGEIKKGKMHLLAFMSSTI